MRTSFHHQSEAQPPNGPLTAATSPDTPSPGPTTQSGANRRFLVSDELPPICGRFRGSNTGRAVSAANEDRAEVVWGLSSLAPEIRFPERGQGAGRDSVRMRQRPVRMQEIGEELEWDVVTPWPT